MTKQSETSTSSTQHYDERAVTLLASGIPRATNALPRTFALIRAYVDEHRHNTSDH